MKSKLLIISIISVFFMTSCGTIFTGTKDTLYFDSEPQGASVYIDGLKVGTTPFSTSVKRSLSSKMAEFKLDGYETRIITLDTKFNAVSIINLANPLAWGIDAATGSLVKYDRKGYDIELDKDKRTSSIENPTRLIKDPKKIKIDTKRKVVDVYVMQK